MTFKPGMHQPVNNYEVDFDAVIMKMAEVKPRTSVPMMGWGKKSHIEASVTKKAKGVKIVFEVFCELTFDNAPADPTLGYTKEEATLFRGVTITTKKLDTEESNFGSVGEVLEYTEFVNRYICDEVVRITLAHIMDSLCDSLVVTDQMIEKVNFAWGSRATNSKEIYSTQFH